MPKKNHAERQRDFQRFQDRLQDKHAPRAGHAVPGSPPPENGVPVFYNEQDQTGPPCNTLARHECWDLKRAGEGKFIERGKKFQLNRRGPAPPVQRYTPSLSTQSDASISLAEVKANVGEPSSTPGSDIPRHVVKRAQQKIRAIGMRDKGTFDPKATLAFGAFSYVDRWKQFSSEPLPRNTYDPPADLAAEDFWAVKSRYALTPEAAACASAEL